MPASPRLNLRDPRWWRVPAGLATLGLAGLLAFHVGKDVAQVLAARDADAAAADPFVTPAAAARAAPAAAPARAPTPAPSATTAAAPDFVVKSILPINGPIKFGQYYWDESRSPGGALVVTVDIAARTISVFRGGHEIGAAAILRGYGDKPTPTGVFPITQKDADHVSNIYEAPMPWMLRLTNDGVSIHGSKVERGYATNGCIGVPDEFAKRLFHIASLGDKVIITDGKRLGVGQPILENQPAGPGAGSNRES